MECVLHKYWWSGNHGIVDVDGAEVQSCRYIHPESVWFIICVIWRHVHDLCAHHLLYTSNRKIMWIFIFRWVESMGDLWKFQWTGWIPFRTKFVIMFSIDPTCFMSSKITATVSVFRTTKRVTVSVELLIIELQFGWSTALRDQITFCA